MTKNGDYRWNNIEVVSHSDFELIDFFIIFNKPWPSDEWYDPSRTIVFQMEPWCYEPYQRHGVKTWGEWANPDENKFLQVRTPRTGYPSFAFWMTRENYSYFNDENACTNKTKCNIISSVCSDKYFDPGHIKRIDFLRFLENNQIATDVYNDNNNFNLKNYVGPTPENDKGVGLIPYKYYFMCENNAEKNFVTENEP